MNFLFPVFYKILLHVGTALMTHNHVLSASLHKENAAVNGLLREVNRLGSYSLSQLFAVNQLRLLVRHKTVKKCARPLLQQALFELFTPPFDFLKLILVQLIILGDCCPELALFKQDSKPVWLAILRYLEAQL